MKLVIEEKPFYVTVEGLHSLEDVERLVDRMVLDNQTDFWANGAKIFLQVAISYVAFSGCLGELKEFMYKPFDDINGALKKWVEESNSEISKEVWSMWGVFSDMSENITSSIRATAISFVSKY